MLHARPKVILAPIGGDQKLERKASGEQSLKARAHRKMGWSGETRYMLKTSQQGTVLGSEYTKYRMHHTEPQTGKQSQGGGVSAAGKPRYR